MALVFEYSDPDELYTAQMEAVNENASLHLEYEMQKVMMEHELRLNDIETRALLENYSDDILEALYEKEMEIFIEAEEGIISKIIAWLGGIIKAIFGIKAENPEAMVVVPDPAATKGAFAKAKEAINKVKGAIKDHKLISGLVGAGALAGAGVAIKKAIDNKKEVKASEAESLKNEGAQVLEEAKNALGDAEKDSSSDVAKLINELKSEVLNPLTNLVNKIGSAIGGKKSGEAKPEENKEGEANAEKPAEKAAEEKKGKEGKADKKAGKEEKKEEAKADKKGKKDSTPTASDKAPNGYTSYDGVKGTTKAKRSISFTTAPEGINQDEWNKSLMAKHIVDNSSVFANKVREIEGRVKFVGKAAAKGNIKNKDYRAYLIKNANDSKFKKVLNDAALALDNPNIGKVFTNKTVVISESSYDAFVVESAYEVEEAVEAPEENVEMMDAFEMAELSFEGEEEKSFEDMLEESAATNEDLEELNKLLENL